MLYVSYLLLTNLFRIYTVAVYSALYTDTLPVIRFIVYIARLGYTGRIVWLYYTIVNFSKSRYTMF